jgi:hypothetical protein
VVVAPRGAAHMQDIVMEAINLQLACKLTPIFSKSTRKKLTTLSAWPEIVLWMNTRMITDVVMAIDIIEAKPLVCNSIFISIE